MKFWARTLRVALATSVLSGATCTLATANDEIEKKIRDEVSRRVNDAITKRIGDDVSSDIDGMPQTGYSNSAWVTPSYTNITSDNDSLIEAAGASFSSDLWTVPLGFDHRFGDNFFLGLSLAYATSATDIDLDGSNIDSDFYADTYTVAPYAAYRFGEYFFVSGMFSYAYTDGKSTMDGMKDEDADSQAYSTEIALNAAAPIDDFILKGKVGWRYAYTELLEFDEPGIDDDSDVHTAVVSTELGYNFDPVIPYVGLQYEHAWPENVPDAPEGDQDFLYVSAGVRSAVTDWFSLGAGVRAEVINNETNQIGGQLEFKARF
ncbi:MAG: autotransporter outer membrane beta-barrel domain-containing protein [Rhodospirillaceae bacterium]|nr:autotransporter outer membrane beta-barrel domain-containing protein [Rhodospirillaceae bacterium]